MRGPLPLDEFAEFTGIPADEIARYRDTGLLDVRPDGSFTFRDVLKVQLLRSAAEKHGALEAAVDHLRSSTDPVVRRLFQVREYTLEEAAARAGRTPDELAALAPALGFPGIVFDEDDIAVLEFPRYLADAGMPVEGLMEGARVYADALRRCADAGMQLGHRYFCEALVREGKSDEEIVDELAAVFGEILSLSAAFVKHLYLDYAVDALVKHSIRHLQPRARDLPPGGLDATVVFADLALFSTLAELEGDEAAVGLVDRTDNAIRELLIRYPASRLVKQIGDEFMLVFAEPVDAVRFSCDLHQHLASTERHAAARIGMDMGTLLYRMGDYYGRAVNAASRITSLAMPNSILVTEPIAKAAVDEGIEVQEIGVRSLRGMDDPIGLYRVAVG